MSLNQFWPFGILFGSDNKIAPELLPIVSFLRLRMATPTSLSNGVLTALSFDTVSDSYNWPAPTVPLTQIVLPYTGVVMIVAHDVDYQDSAVAANTGARRVSIERNGDANTRRAFAQQVGVGGGNNTAHGGVAVESFTANDTLKLYAYQNSGGTLANPAMNDLFLWYLAAIPRTFA